MGCVHCRYRQQIRICCRYHQQIGPFSACSGCYWDSIAQPPLYETCFASWGGSFSLGSQWYLPNNLLMEELSSIHGPSEAGIVAPTQPLAVPRELHISLGREAMLIFDFFWSAEKAGTTTKIWSQNKWAMHSSGSESLATLMLSFHLRAVPW